MSTKALAQKLGKLRTRYFDGSSRSANGQPLNGGGQAFKYLFILDFESTCWENRGFAAPEIIEFPCILLEVSSGRVLDEFRTYVCPVEHPILSSFCTKLTGITQEVVDNEGVPLGTALLLFKKWITSLQLKYDIVFLPREKTSATFLTWSSWDLGVCLEGELKRKQITRPQYFNAWIDIRDIYSKFYLRRPEGLNGALKDLGFSFDGREHSGIDDAKNTGKLVTKMIQDGCSLGITKCLPGFSVPEVYKAPNELMYGNKMIKKLKPSTKKSIERCPMKNSVSKKTPPLCACGRRSKYFTVSKVGPNHGRSFFACVLKSCGFFSWDQLTISAQSPAYDVRLPINNNKENKIYSVNKCVMSKTMIDAKKSEPQQDMCTNNKMPHPSRKLYDVTNSYFGNVPIHPITTVVNRTFKRTLGIKRRSY